MITERPGLAALSDFSSSLTRVLGSLDESANDLKQSIDRVADSADRTQRTVADHEIRLRILESETESQRGVVENAMQTAASTQKLVATPRKLNKLDMEMLRASFDANMVDAVQAAEETPRILKEGLTLDPTANQEDQLKYLLDRVGRLEQGMKLQSTVNSHIDRLATQDSVKRIYDSLFKELTAANYDLALCKVENENLKKTVRELCESQNAQNQYMLDMLRSVGSKTKMELLQEDLKDLVKQRSCLHGDEDSGANTPAPGIGRLRQFSKANLSMFENDDGEEGNRPNSGKLRKSRPSSGGAPLKKVKSEVLQGISEAEEGEEEVKRKASVTQARASVPVAVEEGAPPSDADGVEENIETEGEAEQQVISSAPQVVRKTIVNKIRKPTKIIHEQVVIEEEEEEDVEQERTIVIRKKVRRKKPKKIVMEEEESDEDDEEDEEEAARREKERAERIAEKERRKAERALAREQAAAERAARDREEDESLGEEDSFGENHTWLGSESLAESQLQRHELEAFRQEILDLIADRGNTNMMDLYEIKNNFRQRLDDLENSTATFKRIAFVLDEVKNNFEGLKAKVDALIAGDSFDAKMAQNLLNKVGDCQDRWSKVYSEMSFALENINDPEIAGGINILSPGQVANTNSPNGTMNVNGLATMTEDTADGQVHRTVSQEQLWSDSPDDRDSIGPKAFFLRARDLAKILGEKIEDIHPRDTVPQTLRKVVPHLIELFEKGDCMLRMDEQARKPDNLDYCFDDLLCSDLTPSLKGLVADALQTTLWILDEGSSKYRLQQAVNTINQELDRKADKSYILNLERELRGLLAHKVEREEFINVTSRLASSAELQRVHSMVSDAHTHGAFGSNYRGHGPGHGEGPIDLQSSPEFQELLSRFESLTKKYVDMKDYVDKLVPKEEVHEALKAVVEEVKTMRRSFVSTTLFKESMKLKADTAQVEK